MKRSSTFGMFMVSLIVTMSASSSNILAAELTEETAQRMIKLLEQRSDSSPPKGAVVAFDRADGCPSDWTEFTAAQGRFILGVDGSAYKLPYVGGKPEYQFEGADTITLGTMNIPAHKHDGITGTNSGASILVNRDGWKDMIYGDFQKDLSKVGGSHRIAVANKETSHQHPIDKAYGKADGSAEPHSNMPPYIALYFCKYEGPKEG